VPINLSTVALISASLTRKCNDSNTGTDEKLNFIDIVYQPQDLWLTIDTDGN